MIRMIAAIDDKRGIANGAGIPWNIQADKKYYKDLIKNDIIVMAHGTYETHEKPLSNKVNYVLTEHDDLRKGFEKLDLEAFKNGKITGDVWVVGGESMFEQALGIADELYLTQVTGDYACTKFFPEYIGGFKEKSDSGLLFSDDYQYSFTVWERV